MNAKALQEFERHMYRCHACLGVFAIEGARVFSDRFSGPTCDCGGHVEHMGKVERDRLIREFDASACDARCTSARGPSCNCQCGGKNHGSNLTVHIRQDLGAAPVISAPDSLAKRQQIAGEFDAALQAAKQRMEDRYGATLAAMRAGQWVADKSAWWAAKTDQDAIRKAGAYLIHGKRISALAKIRA